ncbi:hypothetical protein CLIB1423_22S00496 [[Candida] railenensis]|uniref:Outer spore wall assembly protein SHE10 n=1 Tax=[Candida] railenensis TaxID=45579 RepID=A0A9P0VZL3_9ASCO|nr:hypothetical protein CLIB1423_22S00496 [[Candida] railenensis]
MSQAKKDTRIPPSPASVTNSKHGKVVTGSADAIAAKRGKKGSCFRFLWTLFLLVSVPTSIIWYGYYLSGSVCPIKEGETFPWTNPEIQSIPAAVNHASCYGLHHYVYPTYSEHISPFLAEKVEPKWAEFDSKFEISSKLNQVKATTSDWIVKIEDVDSKFQIVSKTKTFAANFGSIVSSQSSKIWNLTQFYIQKLELNAKLIELKEKKLVEKYYLIISNYIGIKYKILYLNLSYQSQVLKAKYFTPNYEKVKVAYLNPVYVKLHQYIHLSKVDVFVAYLENLFEILYAKGSDIYERKLQTKHHFLRDELYTLLKFQPASAIESDSKLAGEDVIEVVKEVLNEEVGEKFEDALEKVEEVEEKLEEAKADYAEEQVVEVEVDDTEDETEDSDDSDEPITVRVTSTITVVGGEATSTDESGLESKVADSEVGSPAQQQIDEELKYWKSKVNKTCESAWKSLDTDVQEFTHNLIENEIKKEISDRFTKIQQVNYESYKVMSKYISYIDKDTVKMKEQEKIIRSQEDEGDDGNIYIVRQDMRDEISKSKEYVLDEVKEIKSILTEYNSKLLKEYYAKAQEVIDVLESFADLTISEFSTRLHTLLSIIEQEYSDENIDDWAAWKEFHKIKETIFNTRDEIFNYFYQYKSNYLFENEDTSAIKVPNGFVEWEEYLRNIHFTANWLIKENVDYLAIVRAQANVAYQLRTATEFDLEALFEKRLKEEKEELEREEARTKQEELEAKESEAEESADESEDDESEEVESDPQEPEIAEEVVEVDEAKETEDGNIDQELDDEEEEELE